MLSIAPLASPDYYLGASASSGESFNYFAGGDGNPAGADATPDPLLRQGRWLGHLGAELGLMTGGAVTAKDFESIYYGLHPGTGRPLRSDGKSKKSQMADAKERAACRQARDAALRALSQARKELKDLENQSLNTPEPDSTAATAVHAKCKQAFAQADQALRQAQQKSLRPGTDLVFSAPKSVSMQWAALLASGDRSGAQAIESAHDRAVRDTFERMQTQFVMTRKRDGASQRVFETVQGVIACQWRHFDARPVEPLGGVGGSADGADAKKSALAGIPDPQLHDHINLFAPVRGADGAIYAAYTDYIRQNIKALGAMYRARLSTHLVEAGYQIERDSQKNGLFFSLCGVSRDQAKALSARTADIEAQMEAGASAREAKVFSRRAKNALRGESVLQAWSAIFEALHLDPNAVKHATPADSIAREIADRGIVGAALLPFIARLKRERQADVRTDAQILDALLQRDAYFSLADVRQLLWEDAQFVAMNGAQGQVNLIQAGGIDLGLDAYVETRMRSLLRSKDLLQVMDPDAPQHAGFLTGLNRFGEPVFTTHSLRARETRLFGNTVPALLNSSGYGVEPGVAMRIIKETEELRTADGLASGGQLFALRDFQLRAVLQAACGEGQLCVQIAGAGMGKTTSAQFTKEILAAQGRRILAVAPSNKAASGLGRELGIAASSIDRLLLDLEAGRQHLDRNTVVFVDEAGMAGFDVMEKLFELATQSGAKLILTGDPEQLPAVARGNVLRKLTQMHSLASKPDALMYLGRNLADWNRISRQKDDWAKQASMYFSQGLVSEGLAEYEKRGRVRGAMTPQHLGEDVAEAYFMDPATPSQKLILATTNAQVKVLNTAVRERLKASGKLLGSWKLPDGGLELSLGDRLVFKERQKVDASPADRKCSSTRNSLAATIAKNEFGTVLSIRRLGDGSLNLQCQLDSPSSDGKPQVVVLNSRRVVEVEHAFATTVHRSQGMTVDSVFAAPGTFVSKELFYVMSTRHRERLSIHMLESDRASILVKAGLNINKLHGLDMSAAPRTEMDTSLGIRKSLLASAERLWALLQKERARFIDVMSRSHNSSARAATTQKDVGHSGKPILSFAQILKTTIAQSQKAVEWSHRHSAQVRDDQLAPRR